MGPTQKTFRETEEILSLFLSEGAPGSLEEVTEGLRRQGFSTFQVGWITHHLFGISVQEGVHRATLVSVEVPG